MRKSAPLFCALLLSLSARRAWIEIPGFGVEIDGVVSLSARRAWIEIRRTSHDFHAPKVALRKESVDRNADGVVSGSADYVALRKESVDRNVNLRVVDGSKSSSLSARRAWIEIRRLITLLKAFSVALRKESVDRNTQRRDFKALGLRRSPQGERG